MVAHLNQKDDDGFITTETDQLERDSYAIVTEPADIDLDEGWNVGWGWGWNVVRDLGDLVTFKVEGSNNDDSKGIFIGVAQESDLMDYLNDIEYDEIIVALPCPMGLRPGTCGLGRKH